MCCIVVGHNLREVYSCMNSSQHRGRDMAGIAAFGNGRIDVVKWFGLVKDFSLAALYKILPSHLYNIYMGHVRYATRGKCKTLREAHPHVVGGMAFDNGSHMIIEDADMAIIHNGQVNESFLSEVDRNHLETDCDTEALLHFYKKKGEYEIMRQIPGAYTLAIADKRRCEVVVMRDRTGIRPGVLGQKDGKNCVVSEDAVLRDIALRENNTIYTEDLKPGYIYYLSQNGACREVQAVKPRLRHCLFEYNYLARVDSVLNGINVLTLRQVLGRVLAEEYPFRGLDWLSFVPKCPEAAARSYASELDLSFIEVFYKMKTERAFLGATAQEREVSISKNLYLIVKALDVIKKGRGGIMDDSIVRGNNSKYTKNLLEGAGVKDCRLLIYTPQIGIIGADGEPRGCEFGVDMPLNDNFIARGKTIREISDEIGMETHYISVEGMLRGFEKLGMPRENLCYYCIGGEHPFKGL